MNLEILKLAEIFAKTASKPDIKQIPWEVENPITIVDGKQISWPEIDGFVLRAEDYDAHGLICTMEYENRC